MGGAAPAPPTKLCVVIGVGSCATGGGLWFDSYGAEGGLNAVLPVDYYIPGCPPRPEAILYGVAVAMKRVDPKVQPYEYEEPLEVRSASGETVFAAGGSRAGA